MVEELELEIILFFSVDGNWAVVELFMLVFILVLEEMELVNAVFFIDFLLNDGGLVDLFVNVLFVLE